MSLAAEKCVSLAEAARRVAAWRAAGERVALASGVFDLLHVGHTRYLARARALADHLVVGVSDDRAAAALEGPGQPVLSASDRSRLVAALRSVDLVVVFEGPTADPLLAALGPNVHAPSAGHGPDGIPERAAVPFAGGSAATEGDPEARSSRELLARVRDRYSSL